MSLGKRKRDTYDPAESRTKRRRIDLVSCSHGPGHTTNPFIAILIPPPRPSLCPLFRLPAELRTQIWKILYGHQTIHVSLKSHNKPAEASHKDLKYTIHQRDTYPFHETALTLPPRTNRQFHLEARAALYATSTFSFDAPRVFHAFALSTHACVRRIQHISIPQLTHHWADALVSSLVGRLTGLRGVHLTHQHFRCSDARPLPHAADAIWRHYWRMIRAFQQHELEAQKTEFELLVFDVFLKSPFELGSWTTAMLGPVGSQYENVSRLQKAFTEGLLEYKPRRLSKRSAPGRWDSKY